MSRIVRLCWIGLLALTLPLKGWALASGAHCQGQVQAMHDGHSGLALVAEADNGDCPHHSLEPADASQGASHDAHHDPSHQGHHTCSACAHCNTGTAPPSLWVTPQAAGLPHAPPPARTRHWQSASLPSLDRPPAGSAQ